MQKFISVDSVFPPEDERAVPVGDLEPILQGDLEVLRYMPEG
jgi:hypothetical protein